MNLEFNRSEKPTVGIEWELALADPTTKDLTPKAPELIEIIHRDHPDRQIEREFLQNTVELVTGIHTTVPEAVGDLGEGLSQIQAAAKELDVLPWSAGSHPFADWRTQPVSRKAPYEEILERTQFWGRQMLIWGLHVHVGISHEDKVWPIINALMTNYPHLLSISCSSPGWNGWDTGYASHRTMLYQQLPTAGIPYGFNNWSQWSDYVAQQSKSGVISHTGAMHFDIRPARKWGTIEIRVSDAPSNLKELAAIAALTHCLVVYYDRKLEDGQSLPSLQPWHNLENKWRACRYGMDAEIITSRDTDEAFVKDDLRRWMELLAPVARQLHCDNQLAYIDKIIDGGAAYQRQRAVYKETGTWADVVDLTCRETAAGQPLF
ncbi:glutamate--cysteine ligase [Corynebacterium mendelii]|uniref:Putative glutamate--cysteine ligase 2 n=1 Tax=Corynebacterium mendelii TaxID=2765362 RepID=A0A939E196_9CORY|nr:glutamate--cysteine ligase [Corynebacterium mendelii]MBN9645130.1 glutamate--cysteine ligase [Corynebacterium mendelii]